MIESNPDIDKRNSAKILDEISNLLPHYVPEWVPTYNKDDLGVGLCKAYADLLDSVIYKLNKVPKRNFIEFLNVLGTTLTSKQAAKLPVTMTLSQGAEENVLVPKETEVVAKASSIHDELFFITESDLLVTFSDLVKVYTVVKDENELDIRIYDHTDDVSTRKPFSFFSGINLQHHMLYLSHDDLFNLENTQFVISFNSSQSESKSFDDIKLASLFSDPSLVSWEYDWKIDTITGKEISNSAKQMQFYKNEDNSIILKKTPTKIGETIVHGIKNRWIRCRLDSDNFIQSNSQTNKAYLHKAFLDALNCPEISKLEISVPLPDKDLHMKSFYDKPVDPDMIFSGDTPLVKDNFYPFGKNTNTSNIFYIASQLFSKKGLSIEILLDYSSDLLSSENNNNDEEQSYQHYNKIDILWEFWNGSGWVLLESIRSTRFPRGWVLGFQCPENIEPSTVNGHQNHWIRGRIDPSYFTNKTRVIQKDNTYEVDYGFGNLPKITGVGISISEQSSSYGYVPKQCITYNNLEYENCLHKSNDGFEIKPFRAFKTMEIDSPSIFLGFDKKILGGPINIFFSILKDSYLPYLENHDNVLSTFKYYCSSSDNSWKKINSSDHTHGLTKTGSLQLILPSEFSNFKIFASDLYWVMAQDKSNKPNFASKGFLTNGVFLNTVQAIHASKTVELLGTSNYSLNQTFKLKDSPISGYDIQLLINESSTVKDYEKEILFKQNKIQQENNTSPNDLWVRWDETEDLYSAKPYERKFTLDRESGIITFGDGVNGKIPPAVRDNIKVEYLTGGGIIGNIPAGEVASLRGSLPFIEKVFNPLDAGAGGDRESIESAINRGPQIIKHREQAVTVEDYEWIIREKFPSVAKVRCLPNTDPHGFFKPGYITITIVESSASSIPVPSSKSLDEIRDYLKNVSNIVVAENLNVVSPIFARISINAVIYPYDINKASEAEKLAFKEVTKFLDPLKGGFYGDGWKFGRITSVSDVYRLLENMPLIDHVEKVTLHIDIESFPKKNYVITTDDDLDSIEINPKILVCNGLHSLAVRWEQY